MSDAFNLFLHELASELQNRGAKINALSLKGKKLIVELANGKVLPLPNLPLPNETLLFVATKFLDAKKIAALFGTNRKVQEEDLEFLRADSGAGSAAVSIFSILAIIVLVLLIVGTIVWFLNNRGSTTIVNPPPSQ